MEAMLTILISKTTEEDIEEMETISEEWNSASSATFED